MKVIGLTGSIASGKSTVTNYLLNKGYCVIDADAISHHALHQGTKCYEKVKSLFDCLDENGNIDRKALGKIVFYDHKKKKQLEDIIHPYVKDELKKEIEKCQQDILFLDVPLLYETQMDVLCDQVIVVYVDESLQIQRLMKRNNILKEEAGHLIHQQISIEEKKKRADIVLDNRKSFEELYKDIERMLKDEIIYE